MVVVVAIMLGVEYKGTCVGFTALVRVSTLRLLNNGKWREKVQNFVTKIPDLPVDAAVPPFALPVPLTLRSFRQSLMNYIKGPGNPTHTVGTTAIPCTLGQLVCPGLHNVNDALSLFDKFITRVLELEEMHRSSSKFALGYQYELEKLRRAPVDESSSVVKDILKSIPSSRVASYQAAGCCHVLSDRRTLVKLNGFFEGLKEHISRAQIVMEELAKLVADVSILMDADLESIAAQKLHLLEHDEDPKQVPFSEESSVASWRTSDYAILMSSILSMLEKDFRMQELVVSELRLDVGSECLQTYTQMWSLRPFIEEGLLQQALALADKQSRISCLP